MSEYTSGGDGEPRWATYTTATPSDTARRRTWLTQPSSGSRHTTDAEMESLAASAAAAAMAATTTTTSASSSSAGPSSKMSAAGVAGSGRHKSFEASLRQPARRSRTPDLHAALTPASNTSSSNRRGSWFGLYGDARDSKVKMEELVSKYYGRPHVIAPASRRLSYLNPDDERLTAMDNNLVARRHRGMEHQEKLIRRTVERAMKNDEWTATAAAKAALKIEMREEEAREAEEKRRGVAAERLLKDAKKAVEKEYTKEIRREKIRDSIHLKQIHRTQKEREKELKIRETEADRSYRAAKKAADRAEILQHRAEADADRRADKEYQERVRRAERRIYEDATRWSEEEARARADMERHTMLTMAAAQGGVRPGSSLSRKSGATPRLDDNRAGFQPGDVVATKRSGEHGVVRFVGQTYFAGGLWVGMELDRARGKHDGVVFGHRYFICRPRHGVFVRAPALRMVQKGGGLSRGGGGAGVSGGVGGGAGAGDVSVRSSVTSMDDGGAGPRGHDRQDSWDLDAVVRAATAAAVASINDNSQTDGWTDSPRKAESLAERAALEALRDMGGGGGAGGGGGGGVVDVSYSGFSDAEGDDEEDDDQDRDPEPYHRSPMSSSATRDVRVEHLKQPSPTRASTMMAGTHRA